MTHPQNIIEVPGVIQKKINERIVFDENGITVWKSLFLVRREFFSNEDIASFRFGIKELQGFSLTFGLQYYIEIKDFNCEIRRIKFNSYCGINNRAYYKIWAELLQNVWDYFMERQLSYYTELYNIQQMFELAGVTFYPDGVSWDGNKIPWDKIALKSYRNYFMIHHAGNPQLFKCCVFSIDWNAVVLQSLLKAIVRENSKVRRTLRNGFSE